MGMYRIETACLAILALTSCGKPNVSGVYIHAADREVTLVQLIQTPDGKLTARLEETTVGLDGVVNDKSANADGAVSGHDLLLRPASAWYGGVQASGTISGAQLTLTGDGFTVSAERSTLEGYGKAVAHLRAVAAGDRRRIAAANAVRATQAATAQAADDLASTQRAIVAEANQLRAYANQLNASIANSPNFAKQAAANTARITRMVETAPRLSDVDRGQLAVAANQLEVATNQIEVARSQYAIGLNQIIGNAAPIEASLQKFCSSPQAVRFTVQCSAASSSIAEMRSAFSHGQMAFMPYKQQLLAELDRQATMIQKIDN